LINAFRAVSVYFFLASAANFLEPRRREATALEVCIMFKAYLRFSFDAFSGPASTHSCAARAFASALAPELEPGDAFPLADLSRVRIFAIPGLTPPAYPSISLRSTGND
jgi:hypothetical protein